MAVQARSHVKAAEHLPRLPRAFVPRRRLWAQLDDATESAVTVLVGPAGSGKTLGVSGWLRQGGDAASVSWVRADTTWTPDRLLALVESHPGLIVVDDAHDLPLATIRAVDQRMDTDPESLRMVLLSRWDLPFTRLAPELLGQYTALRGELLRLDETEEAALVAAHVHTDAAEVARAIAPRTRGWCAAVVLTARAVAAAPDPLDVARRYAEGGGSVADRVASEVFASLQPRQRHLLLCVANEPAVTPAVAVHLSHDALAGEVLAELESTGLLVTRIPLPCPASSAPEDDDQVRYAIHPLLSEVVRRRTAAGGVDVLRAAATVARAVQLDVARGDTEHAFRRLVACGDHAIAAELLAEHGPTLLLRGHGDGINAFALAHPSSVDVHPAAWFTIALERWVIGAISCARHWLDRVVSDPLPDTPTSRLQVACAQLMRARLGLESIPAALAHAERVLADDVPDQTSAELPVLLTELAVTQTWAGDLDGASGNLARVLQVSRSRELPALTAIALSQLAFNEFMQGRESACVEVSDEILALLADNPRLAPFSWKRAQLVRELATFCDLPAAVAGIEEAAADPPLHPADLTTKFWARMRRARLALAGGSVSAAERVLEIPLEVPELPTHLAIALDLERAFLAALSGDQPALTRIAHDLTDRGAGPEAAMVTGLRLDLAGDRRAAVSRYEEAAAGTTCVQPPVRALALVAAAQLRDGLGDTVAARDLLNEAIVATEVRRNAVPFLGWSRHGTPVGELLARHAARHPSSWAHETAAATTGMAGITTFFSPTTALPHERAQLPVGAVAPTLSPRERDVLNELARGSTYADIAATLFVSENTVKTHVSSLYSKLSVNRRSAALAVARSMHLL